MAVRIRLKRMGKKHQPFYRVVVVDSRKKRDGRVIEEIGTYDPTRQPSHIQITGDRAQYWLSVGAQPSDQVLNLLKLTGDWAAHKGVKDPVSRVKVAETDAQAAAKAIQAAEDEATKRKAERSAQKAKEAEQSVEEAESAQAEEAETAGEDA